MKANIEKTTRENPTAIDLSLFSTDLRRKQKLERREFFPINEIMVQILKEPMPHGNH